MSPDTEDAYHFCGLVNLIHKPVFSVDPSRVQPRKIADKLFIRRRIAERIFTYKRKQCLESVVKMSSLKQRNLFCRTFRYQ